jgi:hypothetical protein
MVQKTFHFMDGLQAGPDSKKQMRRHVMMGKNAGKKIHRPSKRDFNSRPKPMPLIPAHPKFANTSIIQSADRIESHKGEAEIWKHVAPNIIGRNIGNTLVTLSVPVQLTTYSLTVVDQCEYQQTVP